MNSEKNITGNIKKVENKFRIKWKIPNFRTCLENIKQNDYISNEVDHIDGFHKSKWILMMYPMGCTKEDEGYISISLKQYFESMNCTATCRLVLYDNKNKVVCDYGVNSKLFCAKFPQWDVKQFIKLNLVMDENSGILINDTLNVYCDININCEVGLSRVEYLKQAMNQLVRFENLDSLYEQLMDKLNFSDVTFILADDRRLHGNKNLLSSMSSVFMAMFSHEMQETILSEVRINDVRYEVLKEFIRFAYFGKVERIDKMALELLVAANKYEIKPLMVLCENHLMETVSDINAMELFAFADLHNAFELKRIAKRYITDNSDVLVHTSQFEIIANYPKNLLLELVRSLIIPEL